jgi:hypothetical protein
LEGENAMSQEKVREILSHVDMSKIDLSSFKLSSKKFNELSHLYRNRVIISCFSLVVHKHEHSVDEVDTALEMLTKVVDNPNIYDYDTIYAAERKSVDAAIDDITTRRNRNINDVKVKAIENRMKDAYKKMRKTIELAMEYGNDFEDELNEEIVERCIAITKNSIENGRQRAAETSVEAITQSQQTEQAQFVDEVECSETSEPINTIEEKTQRTKVGFWKRIFGKVSA